MWLLLNHVRSLLAVICTLEITVLMWEAQAYRVVLSAYFSMSESSHSSIEFILKGNRPKIEPCGTPYSIFNLLLKHYFILVRWVRLLKQENISLRDKGESPYQCSFATSKE